MNNERVTDQKRKYQVIWICIEMIYFLNAVLRKSRSYCSDHLKEHAIIFIAVVITFI